MEFASKLVSILQFFHMELEVIKILSLKDKFVFLKTILNFTVLKMHFSLHLLNQALALCNTWKLKAALLF